MFSLSHHKLKTKNNIFLRKTFLRTKKMLRTTFYCLNFIVLTESDTDSIPSDTKVAGKNIVASLLPEKSKLRMKS